MVGMFPPLLTARCKGAEPFPVAWLTMAKSLLDAHEHNDHEHNDHAKPDPKNGHCHEGIILSYRLEASGAGPEARRMLEFSIERPVLLLTPAASTRC